MNELFSYFEMIDVERDVYDVVFYDCAGALVCSERHASVANFVLYDQCKARLNPSACRALTPCVWAV